MAEEGIARTSKLPLAGRTVVVTRAADQAKTLVDALEVRGAAVVSVAVIEIVDPPDLDAVGAAIRRLPEYDWVVLTSVNAVERFFARLVFTDRTGEALSHVKLAAVGSATAARIAGFGVPVDLVPDDFRAEGLVAAFQAMGLGPGTHVLMPRALHGRDVLPTELRAMGVEVDVVPVYQTVAAPADPEVLARVRQGVDAVTFTSPSTVRNFIAFMDSAGLDSSALLDGAVAASIGPVTSAALVSSGIEVGVEAHESTVVSLAEAIAEYFSAS